MPINRFPTSDFLSTSSSIMNNPHSHCPWTNGNTTNSTNSSNNSTNNSPPSTILPTTLSKLAIPTLDTHSPPLTNIVTNTTNFTYNNHHQSIRSHNINPLSSNQAITSSSVSSPSAPDSDCAAEVDELLEGIDRARIDDLWTTPRASNVLSRTDHSATFRAGLFAPPEKSGAIAAIAPPPSTNNSATNSSSNLSTLDIPKMFSNTSTLPRSKTLANPNCSHAIHHAVMTSNLSHINNNGLSSNINHHTDFPRLFKVSSCPTRQACIDSGNVAECFYYHSIESDRRRVNVAVYKPHMCRFIEEAGGCRKADRCPFAHNDFERRYHPDRYGKETCRDFLRGDCPRRYCTFRHEVSNKVQVALEQMGAMNDKELLQLVLKIDEQNGRALCEKLLRRFGHGKKHSGWKLEGFNPKGRDDQKVKYVVSRVEEVKKALRLAGEKKWAASLKTTSLRDMMSGVRKVAEEMRERCRAENNQASDMGSEVHRLIRSVFSNTNWSCHSQEGDNPFLVTPDNQNEAVTAIERLVELLLGNIQSENKDMKNENKKPMENDNKSYNNGNIGTRFAGGSRSNQAVGNTIGSTSDVGQSSKLWNYSNFGQLTA